MFQIPLFFYEIATKRIFSIQSGAIITFPDLRKNKIEGQDDKNHHENCFDKQFDQNNCQHEQDKAKDDNPGEVFHGCKKEFTKLKKSLERINFFCLDGSLLAMNGAKGCQELNQSSHRRV